MREVPVSWVILGFLLLSRLHEPTTGPEVLLDPREFLPAGGTQGQPEPAQLSLAAEPKTPGWAGLPLSFVTSL